jgi:L-alanine-DL-glutamate epimerase-like enolase superfamily enzyme
MAEAPPRPTIYGETVYSITSVIARELAPRILGLPVTERDLSECPHSMESDPFLHIQARLHEVRNNHVAKGAVDMALHDAVAQHLGLSLVEYCGATEGRLRVSYILGIGDRERVLAEARRVVDQGVRVLKVKVGRDWEADKAMIMELRSELGPGVDMYADANECLSAGDAPRRLAELAALGLHYCEEPLPVELIPERARLRQAEQIPLIADDSVFTWRDLQREMAFDTFDILNIKTARTGYTESLAMLRMAQAGGKGVMVGSQASAGLGTARAALFAARRGVDHPCELSFGLKLKEDIVDRPIVVRDGYVYLCDIASVKVDRDLLDDARVTLS